MLDLLLEIIQQDAGMGPDAPPRVQRIVRAGMALIGAFLGAAGILVFALKDDVPNLAMRLGMMGVFLGVAWFCLVTIGLRRSPKASGLVLLGSFVVLFAGAVMQ